MPLITEPVGVSHTITFASQPPEKTLFAFCENFTQKIFPLWLFKVLSNFLVVASQSLTVWSQLPEKIIFSFGQISTEYILPWCPFSCQGFSRRVVESQTFIISSIWPETRSMPFFETTEQQAALSIFSTVLKEFPFSMFKIGGFYLLNRSGTLIHRKNTLKMSRLLNVRRTALFPCLS